LEELMNHNTRPRIVLLTTIPFIFSVFFRGHIAYLKSRGFEIIAISSPGPFLDSIRIEMGIEVHTLPMERQVSPWADLIVLWRLRALFSQLRPNIVHGIAPKAALLGALAARAAGVRRVMISVFGLPQMTRFGPMRMLLDATTRLSCTLADRVWSDSDSILRTLIEQRLCPQAKLTVLGNGSVAGVDAQGLFSPDLHHEHTVRTRYGIPLDAMVIGYVGRINRDKGMRELAEAWRMLRSRWPALHLLLVGPVENNGLLAELFTTDPRVHQAGMQTDIPAYLAAMNLFVMPSYREGFGVANIEAAAMRLPVVSTSIPGCVDSVVDGITGTLVPPRDATALAGAIERYLADSELRQRHGAAGRDRVLRDFRPEVIEEALCREYLCLLK
jgi:glycosyltransferase involved in cell wall biosynthesis